MDDKQNSQSELGLLMVALVFFGYMFIVKVEEWISQSRSHQWATAGVVALLIFGLAYWALLKRKTAIEKRANESAIIGPAPNAVYCGTTKDSEEVYAKTPQRAMHTQVIGTTNAGKTESVILPWAIQDIEQGRGLILIDGKSDKSLLDKLWAYIVKSKRQNDFRLFSLSNIEQSYQFNPLIGGTPEEISERIFNSFEFENPYYRSIQFEVFSQVMRIMTQAQVTPTFLRLHQAIANPAVLKSLARKFATKDPLKQWADYYQELPPQERAQRTSGLLAAISHFAYGKAACLFNTEQPTISLEEALAQNQIIYFQLPVLLSPFLGQASGKMILQTLQGAVANRHRGADRSPNFYSVFLDDFTEYLYPGFVSILNKSRSANVGIVFAHQALGDIKTLGDAIANSILTNANMKIFMRGNDPDSTEYFAKVIGTEKAIKFTERTKTNLWSRENTGDASAREVDEFIVHPNTFKKELGVGEALMVIPHARGSKTVHIKFKKFDDLPPIAMEPILKTVAEPIEQPDENLESKKTGEKTI